MLTERSPGVIEAVLPPEPGPVSAAPLASPSMLGAIHAFGSACFFVFGGIYLAFIHSEYLFLSNVLFGTLCAAHWYVTHGRAPEPVRAATFLAIVYTGLVNVVVHLGPNAPAMVFWGMSIAIAAAFMMSSRGVLAWLALSLAFYPLTSHLAQGPLADRAIPMVPAQTELLAAATYTGLLLFLAYSFVLFRRRLDRALGVLGASTEALRKSEASLAESQRVARIGSFDVDLGSWTWTSSPLLDEILGIDAAYLRDLAGGLALAHPDDRDDLQRVLLQDVATGQAPLDRTLRLARRVQDQDVWVQGRGEVVRDASGQPVRIVGTVQDISGLKRGEQERLALESRLFQAQKLESLGVLAGGIAHDFNNLLTGVLGNIALARGELAPQQAEVDAMLQDAETAATRAGELTRQMLAFSGKGRFVIERVDVNAALLELVDLLKSNLPPHVTVELDLDASAPRVLGDASQIRQVFMNLILNAGEAIGEAPGVVTIRSGLCLDDGPLLLAGDAHEASASSRRAYVEITDTGCGMDEATLARIFDPFFTTKFTGRGLGLAAVRGIVEGHGGTIAVRSTPGRGSTFALQLPCAPDGVAGVARPGGGVAQPAAGRVLVVDDEAAVRRLVCRVLEGAGMAVVEAADGQAALEIVGAPDARFDLVLLDLTMPRMGGPEVFAALKELRPDLRVVLMSGFSRDAALLGFEGAAPDGFVEKPFNKARLLAVVTRLLGAARPAA